MKSIKQWFVTTGFAALLCVGTITSSAQQQGGGNFGGGGGGGGFGAGGFDPAQIQQMIMDNMREQLEVKDDSEWKVISVPLQKIMDARMQAGMGGMGMFGMMGRRAGGGAARAGGGNAGGGRGNPFGALLGSNPEGEALQKAIDDNAPSADLKNAIAKLVEARKQKQAALEKAQADYRKLLSVRQEAISFSLGLL